MKILCKKNIFFPFFVVAFILTYIVKSYALTAKNYENFIEKGSLGISGADLTFNEKGQMYRKFGHFIIDGLYTGGDPKNPFYNEENTRDLAVEAVACDSTYDVYAEIEDDEIDYTYEDDEELNATEYDRAAFKARLDAMSYGNTYHSAVGYGKYNLRPGKNLTAFIKFAYDFYKDSSGDVRVGCKTTDDLEAKSLTGSTICPMEYLEPYTSKSYISGECVDTAFKNIWKECTRKWNYEGEELKSIDNIFEHLQDIFMAYVYLKPGLKTISANAKGFSYKKLSEEDYAAILSMMYERFGGRPINPSKVESSDAIPKVGTADVLGALIDFPEMSMADKIYTYMIEIKYKNSDLKLASWLKEYEDVMRSEYQILDAETYDRFMKAYQEAFREYGQDSAYDTLLDYGCVLDPNAFESKIGYEKAIEKFKGTIKRHFGNSSFYNNRNNANYVAKSYLMAKKICENSAFSDITDIYACDMDVIEHTKGYESTCILLADTQVVELNDILTPGSMTDSDYDGLTDYVEAGVAEEVDITNMLIDYCKYNNYSESETNEMIAKNSKITMYNYKSNPILPDSDFDGKLDWEDKDKLNNEFKSTNETANFSNVKINFNQDYRYFFMDQKSYYEDVAEMGLILSNMASKKKGNSKTWSNKVAGTTKTLTGLLEYLSYIGMTDVEDHSNEKVPYAISHHDTIAQMGKVNNLERNIITLVIGEDENYKDILAANYDGSLGMDGSFEGDYHHVGYDIEAGKIYEKLIDYDNNQNPNWKNSFWIVGYGTGGSIANLVAKKLIDNKGNKEPVYCYTYQAPNTINRNNLDKRIYNEKYQSIFNIENDDEIMLSLLGDDAGFTKYGIIKRLSLGDNEKAKNSWQRITNKTYKSGSNFLYNLFSDIFNSFKSVFGFSGTYVPTDDLDPLELARVIYAERMKQESPAIREIILEEYRDNSKLLIAAANINTAGEIADLQAKDFTAVDTVMINNLSTMLQNTIDVRKIDKVITVIKALEQMGKWYVENVYTYQGADKKTRDIERNAIDNASESAYKKWREKITGYMLDKELITTGDFDNENIINSKLQSMEDKVLSEGALDTVCVRYVCDKFERLGYIQKYVYDDCSKFANSVLYHFFKRRGFSDAEQISLQWGSGQYARTGTNLMNILSENNRFRLYTIKEIKSLIEKKERGDGEGFELKEGDILYHAGKTSAGEVYNDYGETMKYGHVEFCTENGGGRSFGWGRVHNDYSENPDSKNFEIEFGRECVIGKVGAAFVKDKKDGIFNENDDNDTGVPYTIVIRYIGE